MPSDTELVAALRAVADAADVEISDDRLRALAPIVVGLLSWAPEPVRHDLGETEPAFGLRLRKE